MVIVNDRYRMSCPLHHASQPCTDTSTTKDDDFHRNNLLTALLWSASGMGSQKFPSYYNMSMNLFSQYVFILSYPVGNSWPPVVPRSHLRAWRQRKRTFME